jgi:teichuronic acid biosynthesis glycosyltransferase TuaC
MPHALWITPGYPWSGDPSAGVFYRTQVQALVRAAVDVTVVAPTPWAPWPLSVLRPRWATLAASPTMAADGPVQVARPRYPNVPTEPSWARPDRMIASATWRVRSVWSAADLVHGHNAVTGIAAWQVARRAGLPLILTFHGSDMNSWPDQHPERAADLRRAVGEASAVIAVSAALVERIRSVTGVEAIHLPIGSDATVLEAGRQPRDEARRQLGVSGDRTVVVFVGHLKRTKGVHVFVDGVLAAGTDFLGVLVGDGPEHGYGRTNGDARERIVYAGARPHEQVPQYLSAADVLVLPSFSEGLPTVIVEAGMLQVPVIASGVGGVSELLGQDRGLVLPEISATAVAAALRDVRANPDAARARADRLAAHVRSGYEVSANAHRLAVIYRSVMDGA